LTGRFRMPIVRRHGRPFCDVRHPGANPTDTELFGTDRDLRATFTAFGMTRRPGRSAANDPGLAGLLGARADAICFRERRALDHRRRVAEHHRRVVPGADGFDRLQARQIRRPGVRAGPGGSFRGRLQLRGAPQRCRAAMPVKRLLPRSYPCCGSEVVPS
jgi:hypothetical protein